MKRNLLTICTTFVVLCGMWWSSSTMAQTTISCFPYTQTFDEWSNCGTSCGNACVAEDGWFNAADDTHDWTTWNGATGSGATGPSSDHTSGGGSYIYFEASSPCNGGDDSAHIETPRLDLTGLTDFTMAYWRHLYGQSMGDLHIDVRTYTGATANPWQLNVVPAFTNNLNAWEADTVNLNAFVGQTIQVRFRATSGSNFYSDMAIDDVEFYTSLTLDASLSSIDAPSGSVTPGIQNVEVSVTNWGSTTLTTATIDWELNSVAQASYNWSGSLATAATESNVVISTTASIPAGNSTIKAWISAPNSGIDQQPCNDTTETSLCTAYRGTFMVGAGQTFTDPLDAFNQLAICGVDSHVVLNVMPGVYTQRVVINPIPGASDTSTITMNGGSPSLVEVTNGNLATFQFDGADWITLRNMNITNTATSNGYGVMFRQNADHNTIDSCRVEVSTGTTSLLSPICWSSSETSPAGSGTNGNFNTVSNNTTVNGYYGIRVQGLLATHQLENRVINNDIQDAYYYGVYAQYQDSIEINQNTFGMVQTNAQADGIYLFDSENFVIDRNDISNVPDYGIYIADGNFDNPADRTSLVTNNFISSTGDRALYFDDVEDVDVFHNTTFGTYGFYVNDIANVDIRNNIFVGTSLYAYFSLDAATVQPTVNLDYNIYWGLPGVTALASLGGTTYPDVPTWQTNFTFWNQNSLEGDPGFVNGFLDMHVTGPLASNVGDNSAGIIEDIDGQTRPFAPATTVDIGADEFFLPPLDAGITNLDNPFAPLTAGAQNVEVTIRNFGTDTLTSAMINWTANGTPQTPATSWSGSLPVGASESNVSLGSFVFPAGNTTLKIWTTAPNAGVDGDNSNDTLTIDICTGLAGTYTVGTGQDYADLQLAFDDMISCGVSAAVILDVQPGTYPTNMVIPPIPGASATNTITVDGGDTSLVTVLGSNLATFRLDGADWITFKNMTIDNNATSNGYGVQFANNADHNTVDSCRVRVATGTTSLLAPISFSASPTAVSTSGQNGNYNTFSNNTLVNGYYGIRVQGELTNFQNLNRIENNIFEDIYYYNIYVQYQDSIEVVGNTLATSSNINGDGLYMLDVQNFIVEENDMTDMADYAMYIADGNFDSVATRRGRVVNNFISSSTDRALYFDDVNEVDVFHNTVMGTYGFYLNDVLDMDCRNNIFVGTTLPAMYSLDAFSLFPNSVFDYNVYYQTGGGNLAYGGGTNYADLPAWQTAFPGFNIASIEGDPVFIGATDLHVVGGAANDVGDNGVGVTIDIDGDARPQTPSLTVDIGADEYTPLALDAEFLSMLQPGTTECGDSMTEVWVTFRNLGQTPITNMTINVNASGGLVATLPPFAYTGNLAFGEVDTVMVGTINTYAGFMGVNFAGWVTLTGDQNTSNDTINPLGTSTFIPAVPQGTALSGCGADSTTMIGANWPGVGYAWYNTATDTVPVTNGAIHPVPSISTQPTYFLGYVGGSDSLQTTYVGGNGQAGNMFDIVGLTSVSISGFSGNFNAGTNTVEVWTRNTSYTVSPNSNAGWTQQGGGPITFPSNGAGVPTRIPGVFNVPLAAGDTLGVFIICTTGGVSYTNGITVGNVFAQNSQIQVLEGIGRGIPTFTGGTFSPRNWNGTIFTGFNGCSALRSAVTATAGAAAVVNLGADVVSCDSTATLDAGNPTAAYMWNTMDTTQMVTVNTSGTYSVDITDTAGCTANDSINVTLNPAPVISLGPDTTICDGTTIMLDAGNPGAQYLWSNSAITQMVNVPGGTYTVTVVDSNNCSNSETILISTSSFPVDLGADTTLCDGASLTLDAGAGATAYLWSTTDMTQTINVNTAGTYSVAATDSLGCDGVDSIVVNTLNTPTAAYTFNVTGAGLTYDFTYTGTAGTTYSWDFGDSSPLATGSTPSHTYAADGSYMVTLIATNDCGSDTITQSLSVVGIERGLRQESVAVYPNPNNGSFTLAFTSYDLSDVDVQIFNLQGKIVYTNQFESVSGSVEEDITLESIASGVYFVRLTSSDQVVTRKLTIE